MSAHGTRTIYGSLERTLLKNGQKFVMVPDESYAKHAKAYEDAGWKRVSRAEASQQAAPKTEAAAPVWHTKLPEAGAPSKAKNGKPDDSRDVIARIAQEAADAITRTQEMNGGKLYAYVLPSTATEHGALRLLPEDQKPPAPWQMAASDGLSAGSMTKEQLTAKLREILQSQPVLASGDNKAKPAERAKPAYAYTPASKIDSPTQGVLANAMARKGEAFARLRAMRAGVKNGTANRLDLLKAESAHKEEVQAVDAAQQQLERDSNRMGLTTRRDQQNAAPEAEDAALKFNVFKVSEGMYGTGVYLAKLPEYASGFADSDCGNVMPVFANIRGGLDRNILPEKRGSIFVAFSPEQVKSAIGNNGDFDGANQDINFSFAGARTGAARNASAPEAGNKNVLFSQNLLGPKASGPKPMLDQIQRFIDKI